MKRIAVAAFAALTLAAAPAFPAGPFQSRPKVSSDTKATIKSNKKDVKLEKGQIQKNTKQIKKTVGEIQKQEKTLDAAGEKVDKAAVDVHRAKRQLDRNIRKQELTGGKRARERRAKKITRLGQNLENLRAKLKSRELARDKANTRLSNLRRDRRDLITKNAAARQKITELKDWNRRARSGEPMNPSQPQRTHHYGVIPHGQHGRLQMGPAAPRGGSGAVAAKPVEGGIYMSFGEANRRGLTQ